MRRFTGVLYASLVTAFILAVPAPLFADSDQHKPAERLITLAPHLAELVYAAGAGDALLATVEYSDYPAEAAALPRIGDAFRIDAEQIMALRPDLVLAWKSGNPAAAIEQLHALGMEVWAIDIRTPEDIAETLQRIGKAAGKPELAEREASRFLWRLAQLEARFADQRELSYFYQVDSRPLYTLTGKHLVSQGLARCGARNIFPDEPGLAVQVSHEAVIAADPDAMIAGTSDRQPDPLLRWRDWPRLRAVKNDALFLLPANEISRATTRWLDSLELACNLLADLREKQDHE